MKLHPRGCSFDSLKFSRAWRACISIRIAIIDPDRACVHSRSARRLHFADHLSVNARSQCQPVKGRSSLVNFVCPSSKQALRSLFLTLGYIVCRKLIKAQSVDAIGFGEIFLFSGKKLFSIFVQM